MTLPIMLAEPGLQGICAAPLNELLIRARAGAALPAPQQAAGDTRA